MDYQWDFINVVKRPSFRKGGRAVAIHYDGTEEPIAPEDVEEFRAQYLRHCEALTRQSLGAFSIQKDS